MPDHYDEVSDDAMDAVLQLMQEGPDAPFSELVKADPAVRTFVKAWMKEKEIKQYMEDDEVPMPKTYTKETFPWGPSRYKSTIQGLLDREGTSFTEPLRMYAELVGLIAPRVQPYVKEAIEGTDYGTQVLAHEYLHAYAGHGGNKGFAGGRFQGEKAYDPGKDGRPSPYMERPGEIQAFAVEDAFRKMQKYVDAHEKLGPAHPAGYGWYKSWEDPVAIQAEIERGIEEQNKKHGKPSLNVLVDYRKRGK